MTRDPRAFLNDVIEAGRAIAQAVVAISLVDDQQSRLIRSSVEREFTIIGEALSQRDRGLFEQIEEVPQIIAFRNKLAYDSIKINDQLMWGVIQDSLPAVLNQCTQLFRDLDGGSS